MHDHLHSGQKAEEDQAGGEAIRNASMETLRKRKAREAESEAEQVDEDNYKHNSEYEEAATSPPSTPKKHKKKKKHHSSPSSSPKKKNHEKKKYGFGRDGTVSSSRDGGDGMTRLLEYMQAAEERKAKRELEMLQEMRASSEMYRATLIEALQSLPKILKEM